MTRSIKSLHEFKPKPIATTSGHGCVRCPRKGTLGSDISVFRCLEINQDDPSGCIKHTCQNAPLAATEVVEIKRLTKCEVGDVRIGKPNRKK